MKHYTDPPKLVDCRLHGPGSELLIVEGDSAAQAVVRLRDEASQAVLPMQGKPLNACKATWRRITQYPLFCALSDALHYPLELDSLDLSSYPPTDAPRTVLKTELKTDPNGIKQTSTDNPQDNSCLTGRLTRYERVVLMFDPDADGIHSVALMMFFFFRAMRPLLDSGNLTMLQPPLFEAVVQGRVSSEETQQGKRLESLYAYTDLDASRMLQDIRQAGLTLVSQAFYRGLAGIPARTLQATCLDRSSRKLIRLSASDALAAQQIFSPIASSSRLLMKQESKI